MLVGGVRFRLAWIVVAAIACGPRPIAIEVRAMVADRAVRCGESYPGIGTTSSALRIADLRMYLSDLRLVADDGREVPIELDQDRVWQYRNVALVDFEDASADCTTGTSMTRTVVRGNVTSSARFTRLRFRVGIPSDLNHADAASAPPPLNYTSLFWSWNGGYKFLRFDGISTGQSRGFIEHLGSTGCSGDGRGMASCNQENRPEIDLRFDPDRDHVVFDLAAMLSESNIDADAGGELGCSSGFDDPDCAPFFHALGLAFGGVQAPAPQRVFRSASN
jgi:uncharacterized repeat protein (TIGR04052 family)